MKIFTQYFLIEDINNRNRYLVYINNGMELILAILISILVLMDLAKYKFRYMAMELNIFVMKAAIMLARAMVEILENITLDELWIG